jgi:hypothetical protein
LNISESAPSLEALTDKNNSHGRFSHRLKANTTTTMKGTTTTSQSARCLELEVARPTTRSALSIWADMPLPMAPSPWAKSVRQLNRATSDCKRVKPRTARRGLGSQILLLPYLQRSSLSSCPESQGTTLQLASTTELTSTVMTLCIRIVTFETKQFQE